VTATDADGDAISFAFSGGSLTDPFGTFSIDPTTGVITVANADNIGSTDEYCDSASMDGIVFTFDVEVTDTAGNTTTGMGTVSANSKDYKITKPAEGDQIATTKDVEFEGTRPKNKKVRVVLYRKESDGTYTEIDSKDILGGDQNKKITVSHNFGKRSEGDYRIKYFKAKSDGTWEEDEGVNFRVKA
jgi:hypothetical protein